MNPVKHTPVPPRWSSRAMYERGAVVWHDGCYYRAEAQNSSGGHDDPSLNIGLWTRLSTVTPPPGHIQHSQGYYGPPPSYHPAPQLFGSAQGFYNHGAPATPGQQISSTYSTDDQQEPSTSPPIYNSSEKGNVSTGSSRGFFGTDEKPFSSSHGMDFLHGMASDSLRLGTLQKEMHDAHDDDELKYELKGKRIWRVGGVGMWAYTGSENEDEVKKKVWRDWGEKHGKDDWIKAARARTDFYRSDSLGVKPLITWKLVERGGHLPDDALPVGREDSGSFLYAARAFWEGGVHLGKAGSHLVNRASISYGSREHTLDIFEVLCGPTDPDLVQWRNFDHGEHANVEGWHPVEGGREKDGTPLFIAKGEYENGVHPGKCLLNDDHACIGWGGGELWVRPFQVLAYCTPHRR